MLLLLFLFIIRIVISSINSIVSDGIVNISVIDNYRYYYR